MANKKTLYKRESPAALSLDIEWGENEVDDSNTQLSKNRPGSRAVSSTSRASSSVSTRSSNPFSSRANTQNIQILRDGFDDEEDWMLEECDSDEGGTSALSVSPDATNTHNEVAYQNMPFSEKWYNNQLTFSRETTDSQLSDITLETPAHRQLVPRENREVVQVDTDEENDIVKQIREEITAQVKQEVKAEESQYSLPAAEEEEDVDPKVKEALLMMRKYDRILEKRTRRERHVKRERIALQKRLRQELDELNQTRQDGHKSSKEELVNTEKFLSLPASVSKFDRDIGENSDDDLWNEDPLFATQPPEYSSTKTSKHGRSKKTSKPGENTTNADSASHTTGTTGSTTNRSNKRRKPHVGADGKPYGKDFIQRNIDLAADAGNAIAMTDDEKKRLADILEDLDDIEEPLPEETESISHHPIVKHPGEGFWMDAVSLQQMTDIDNKLQKLMGDDEYDSLLNTPTPISYESLQLFSRTHNPTSDDEITRIGERALQETREYRDQQARLSEIEKKLSELSTAVQSEIDSPRLSDDQLTVLLDQCRKMMSRATAETDALAQSPRSVNGVTSATLKLEDSVLRSLLDQARAEGVRSRGDRPDISSQPDEASVVINGGQLHSQQIQ